MYKIMIADDEVLARVGIAALIPWEKHGFVLVGEADNGETALEMAGRLKPDIIITDIKMPVMDGIGLIKAMKEINSDTRFLVLSSYNDFSYVKEAMKYGADEYILKLQLEADSLLKALTTLTEKLDKDREEREKRQNIEKYYDVGVPLVKEKLLKDLIFKKACENQDLENQMAFLNINLPDKNLLCFVLHTERSNVHEQYKSEELYLLDDSIIMILDGVISKYGVGYALNTRPMEYTIIFSLKDIHGEKAVYEIITQLTNNIRKSVSTYMNMAVYIGVSNIHQGYHSIRLAYSQALKAANDAFAYPDKSVLRYSEIHPTTGEMDYKLLLDEFAELERKLAHWDFGEADRIIENIKQNIVKSRGLSKEYLIRICSVMFFIINSFLYKQNIFSESIAAYETNLHDKIQKFNTTSQFIEWIGSLQKEVIGILKSNHDERTIIVKAKRYIQEHYAEDISLTTVADYLNLSSGYLSILYKKETGENFIDYIIHFRVEKARELLRTTDLKIYEVAKKVGYENIYYFSRIFSKVVGVSPKQYQSNSHHVQKK